MTAKLCSTRALGVVAGLLLCGSASWSQQGNVTSVPNTQASFRSLPVTAPAYSTGPYAPYPIYNYNGPVGGALSGSADVINAQGQLMVNQQQAFQMREQYKQMKIDTRRKQFDEYMYERAVGPTVEDERERMRIENIRRSRNDPPPTEIWSGKALNDLLLAIQQQQAQRGPGPQVPLDQDALRQINVSAGAANGGVGVLKNGGKPQWPIAFRQSVFEESCKKIDDLSLEAAKQAASGAVDGGTIQDLRQSVDKLTSLLRANVADVAPNDYMEGKKFLNDFGSTIKTLQDPNVGKYFGNQWAAKGNTVSELVGNMGSQGLKFAPAVKGEEAAYNSVHQSMVAYYAGPDRNRPWDPFAK